MDIQKLAMEIGRRMADHEVKVAFGDDEPPRFRGSDLAVPAAAGLGALGGAYLGAHRDRIGKALTHDPDLSRIADALKGIARRAEGTVRRHPAASGAVAGAGLGGAAALSVFGLRKLMDVFRERENMRGQLAAQSQMPQMMLQG